MYALALLAATAVASAPEGFSYGSGHGSYGTHRGHEHKRSDTHKNPWQHTVVTHKTANGYQRDPWDNRDEESAARATWYSPYQQFSPPQIQYKPPVSHAIFATCTFPKLGGSHNAGGPGVSEVILLAQMPGKPIVYKR